MVLIQQPTRVYYQFDVKATVTISDEYTFAPEGRRLSIETYQAANFLQKQEGYPTFSHTMTFENTYTGLRTDQIMGFAFHRDRSQ